MVTDVLSAIRGGMNGFSKGQKRIANYILESFDKAAFMTASKLGKTAQVSESTVVRFAAELGYRGYPEMQNALQEMVRNRLTSVQRIESANVRLEDQDVASMVLQSDIHTLRMTNEALDRSELSRCVDAIASARNVYILGVRSSAAIASYLNFYLRTMLDNVRLVTPAPTSELMEQLLHVGPEDVLIGISLPRYSQNTVKAMHFAGEAGCRCIAITDNLQAPLARVSNHVLIAKSEMVSIVDSLVAPMSVANTLVVALSRKLGKEFSQTMAELERLWAEYDVYDSHVF